MSDFDDVPALNDADAPQEDLMFAGDVGAESAARGPGFAAPPDTFYPPPNVVGPPPNVAAADMAVAPERGANDGYAFAAIICAIAGFVIPVLPSAAALMLVRATEEPLAAVPLSPSAQKLAATAQTLAYVSLTLMSVLCAALLLGILGRVIS